MGFPGSNFRSYRSGYHSELFKIGGRPAGAYVRPPFEHPEAIVASIRDIIMQQGELFGGFKREFFVVSLSPRPRIAAGVAIDNAFVMFTDAKKTLVLSRSPAAYSLTFLAEIAPEMAGDRVSSR